MSDQGYETQWGATAASGSFDVVLTAIGRRKIEVIREVRRASGRGLKEAKELVEAPPATVLEAVDRERAGRLEGRLREVGAAVDVVPSSKPLRTDASLPSPVSEERSSSVKQVVVALVFVAVALALAVRAYG